MTDEKLVVYGGIDAGVTGALVLLDVNGVVLEVHDAPTIDVATAGRTKKGHVKMRSEYDVASMARVVGDIAGRYTVRRIVLERIHAMPAKRPKFAMAGGAAPAPDAGEGRGTLAAISLAECAGMWRGVCAANRIPVQRVSPATWKAALVGAISFPADVKRSQRSALLKERARSRALELFPAAGEHFARKKDHGRSEAALLAEYGRRLG